MKILRLYQQISQEVNYFIIVGTEKGNESLNILLRNYNLQLLVTYQDVFTQLQYIIRISRKKVKEERRRKEGRKEKK